MSDKTKIKLGSIIFLAVIALSLIISQIASPDFPLLWNLKRSQEKVFLRLKSNPQEKLDYMKGLLDRRLDELSKVVSNENYGYVLKSSLRYSTLAGQITEQIITNNFKDEVQPTIDQFTAHQKVLMNLYEIYPKNIPNNEDWKFIQDDYNYLKIYLDKLQDIN